MSHPEKVCIVGFQYSAWLDVPWPAAFWKRKWHDFTEPSKAWKKLEADALREAPHWERWGFNGLYRSIRAQHFTRWFELHSRLVDPYSVGAGWREPVKELRAVSKKIPLYLCEPDPEIPLAKVYPRAEVEALTTNGKYHAGSFDWMVALAILEGFKEIRIVGVNFQAGGEPISARPCLEYWLGVAEGRGIKTKVIGGDCFRIFDLLRSDIPYGFEAQRLVEERPRVDEREFIRRAWGLPEPKAGAG